jgi:outer membrane lipoprotein-sorting protein
MKGFRAVCLVILLVECLVMGCMQMSAKEIAKKVEEKYNGIKDMKGTMIVITDFQGKKKVEKIEFAMKKPDKYWSSGDNYTMVSDGKIMWIYDKKKNEVVKIKLPQAEKPKFDYGELVKDLLKNNEVKLLGNEEISGRDCYVIEVVPRNKTFYVKQKLWIDKEFWYPLKIEINYGEFNSTIEYKDVKFNIGIPDSFFEFKPPKGAKIVEQEVNLPKKLTLEEAQKQVNFTIVTPEYTAGYKFDYVYVFKSNGKEMVTIYYTKDDQKLVITESKGYPKMPLLNATVINVNSTTFEIAHIFDKNVLRIRSGDFEITISAGLPKDELINIGKSIVESKEWKKIRESLNESEGLKSNVSITINNTTVFFFYSQLCPHCKEIKPYITNLTKKYGKINFVFCDVNNYNRTCSKIMEKYRVMFVPTAVVIGKNGTTILTGSMEIKNRLEEILNED